MEHLTELLASCPLFEGVALSRVAAMARHPLAQVKDFAAGDVIYDPAHYRRSLGVVVEGAARVIKTGADGHRLVLNVLEGGQLFGVAALFGPAATYVSTVEALQGCRVVFLPQELMEEQFTAEPRLVLNYIRYLSGRIHFLNRKIDGFIGNSVRSRVVAYLTERSSGGGEALDLGCSLTQLSQRLDVSRASLYRALDCLEAAGLIRRCGRSIAIPDLGRLARSAALEEPLIEKER